MDLGLSTPDYNLSGPEAVEAVAVVRAVVAAGEEAELVGLVGRAGGVYAVAPGMDRYASGEVARGVGVTSHPILNTSESG